MSKLDHLRAANGGNAAESMGMGVRPAAAVVGAGGGPPERLKGVGGRRDAMTIPVAKLDRDPEQPREEFDPEELEQLATSLKQHGQIQPIAAWWDEGASVYRIAAGERRWRASKLAGLQSLAVTVLPARPAEGQLIVLQLAENMHRAELRPIEQARAFRRAMDSNGWTASRLADELAITVSLVSRLLCLLNLPDEVQSRVESGELPGTAAYEVSKLDDPAAQVEVAARVVAEGLTRAQTVEIVRREAKRSKPAGKGRAVARPAKPFSRSYRRPEGRIAIDLRRGLDASSLPAMLRSLADEIEAAVGQDQEAA